MGDKKRKKRGGELLLVCLDVERSHEANEVAKQQQPCELIPLGETLQDEPSQRQDA